MFTTTNQWLLVYHSLTCEIGFQHRIDGSWAWASRQSRFQTCWLFQPFSPNMLNKQHIQVPEPSTTWRVLYHVITASTTKCRVHTYGHSYVHITVWWCWVMKSLSIDLCHVFFWGGIPGYHFWPWKQLTSTNLLWELGSPLCHPAPRNVCPRHGFPTELLPFSSVVRHLGDTSGAARTEGPRFEWRSQLPIRDLSVCGSGWVQSDA